MTGALDVNRLTVGAALAVVRHQRIGFLFAPADRLQFVQGTFELVEFASKALQVLLGSLLVLAGLGQNTPANGQLRAFFVQVGFLFADRPVQREDFGFFILYALVGGGLVAED